MHLYTSQQKNCALSGVSEGVPQWTPVLTNVRQTMLPWSSKTQAKDAALTRQGSLLQNPHDRWALQALQNWWNIFISSVTLSHHLWSWLRSYYIDLKRKDYLINIRKTEWKKHGETLSSAGKVKSLFLWTSSKTRHNLNAVCGLAMPDSKSNLRSTKRNCNLFSLTRQKIIKESSEMTTHSYNVIIVIQISVLQM